MYPFAVPTPPTAAWLTDVLYASGHLVHGQVVSVDTHIGDAFNSRIRFLQVRYSVDAAPVLPTRFVLKQNEVAEWAKIAGAEEVKFYQLIATLPDHPPITVPCYAAAYDEARGDSYLLLADLSTTHVVPVPRDSQLLLSEEGVPSKMVIGAVVDTLAQLHAYWWQHPLITENIFPVGYWSRDAERFALYLARRRRSWERLYGQAQDWFPAELRTFYEQLFDQLEGHWETHLRPRFAINKNLTLLHGDAYFANFLTPKVGATGRTYLLDWQSPGFDLGAYDLVNLCATFWTSQQRNKLDREMSILQRYHHGLLRHGVTGYSWEQLLMDYRSGLIFWVLMPVQDGGDGAAKDYWWPKMHCLVAAFEEWECMEMLGIL
ncbi:MAG: phosphotransferase [Caldilineaceae bacterium]|nr:phosphotransferase [Caldilineaceae bacterium]